MSLIKRVILCACLLLSLHLTGVCERKKVGLVLSGGGAKGVAHIGVLKVLEEAGIPIDYIAGTSMGAIIGALYAIGYDAQTMDSLVRRQDWPFLLSDMVHRHDLTFAEKEKDEMYLFSIPILGSSFIQIPVGFVSGQNINKLFTDLTLGYHDMDSFDDLPIPYACVATDLKDGKEFILRKGSLPMAMRASMAIPGAFAPVNWDSTMLVDGGVVNNFPVDIVREMGADIVIGVDVSAELRELDELHSALGVLDQLVSFLGMEKYKACIELTDLYIKPDIVPYSAASFDKAALDTLISRGEDRARVQWDEIIKFKELIGIQPEQKINTQQTYSNDRGDSIYINKIHVEGINPADLEWVKKKCRITENSFVSMDELQRGITLLYGTGLYTYVNYKLSGKESQDLILILKPKHANLLNIGFRFDNEDKAALLLNTSILHRTLRSLQFELTGRLSVNPYVRTDIYFGNMLKRKLGLSYMFRYNDLDLYKKGKKESNFSFYHHIAELSFSDINLNNFKFNLSTRYEHYNLNAYLTTNTSEREKIEVFKYFFSYNVQTFYDTYNKKYYPTKGIDFRARYSYYTDDLFDYSSSFSAIYAKFGAALSVGSRFCILPAVAGRVVTGDNDIPFVYRNFAGGMITGRYFEHQLAFHGIRKMEVFDDAILEGRMKFRYRLGSKHYVSVATNYMQQEDKISEVFDSKGIWGGSVGYSYDLLMGPMDVVFSLSNWDKKLGFYFDLGFYF